MSINKYIKLMILALSCSNLSGFNGNMTEDDKSRSLSVCTLRGHTSGVTLAKWSPNREYIITVCWDETKKCGIVKIWNAGTGKYIRILAEHKDSAINSAEWSSNGEYIVTASEDNTAKVLDVCKIPEIAESFYKKEMKELKRKVYFSDI